MTNNWEKRCMYKIDLEKKVEDLDTHNFTEQDYECLRHCNGYDKNCYMYTPIRHVQHFYKLFIKEKVC